MNLKSEDRNKNLKQELEALKHYMGNEDKESILIFRISNRLNKSLIEYYSNLTKSLDKLTSQDDEYNVKVIKHLNKDK